MWLAKVAAFWRLSRAEGAFLALSLIFFPYYLHSFDLAESLALSLPVVPISLCAYIINDMNDLERDAVNHPHRVLPTGKISLKAAASIYIIIFIISLIMVRVLIAPGVHYPYLVLFIASINYGTIVDHLPKLKNIYIAATCLLPFVIANTAAGTTIVSPYLMIAVFFFTLGREMLMDVRDQEGDGQTLAQALPGLTIPIIAFALHTVAIGSLVAVSNTRLRWAALAAITIILIVVMVRWRHARERGSLVNAMKIQMALFLAFLV